MMRFAVVYLLRWVHRRGRPVLVIHDLRRRTPVRAAKRERLVHRHGHLSPGSVFMPHLGHLLRQQEIAQNDLSRLISMI